jgi:hypothetical protein
MTTVTADPITPLTPAAKRVAARLVYGDTDAAIAAHLYLSVHGVKSQLQAARRHVGCPPGASRAVLVHALLTARHIDPPACRTWPAGYLIGTRAAAGGKAVSTEAVDCACALGHARRLRGCSIGTGQVGASCPCRPVPPHDGLHPTGPRSACVH